jgi:ubiquinone biosynthesis protein
MSLVTLPRTVKTFARLRVIAQVLSRHGFGHFVDRLQLGRYVPSPAWLRREKEEEHEVDPLAAIGTRLVRVCEELGPTFVKLGQIASTRPDILPPQILTALEKLQDNVAPFSADQARRIFQEDTGVSVDKAFRHFTDHPFACGSIAQVHRATTIDGQEVVVKIKRPGVDHVVQLDIYVLQWMAERAEALFPEMRPYHPRTIIDEFADTVRRELDFVNEASTTTRFFDAFKDDPHIQTPQVRWDLTGNSVLTMEYMDGLRLRDALDGDEPIDKKALARQLSECFLHQYFEMGLFHADPHPGNLLIRPPDGIVLFDFGMVGQIDDELVGRLVIGIIATVNKEIDVLIDVLADLGALGRSVDRQVLARDLRQWLEKYYGLPIKRLELGTLFRELIETVRRNDVVLPRDFVAIFKSLATAWGVVLQLDPELQLLELLKPKLSKLLRERFSPRRLLRIAGLSTWHLATVLRDAPRVLRDVMRGIGRGQFQINIKHENLDYLASELDRSSNRLAFSVLVASMIIGSTMLLSMEDKFAVFGVPIRYLGFVGYAITFFMAAWLLISILRSGKMS